MPEPGAVQRADRAATTTRRELLPREKDFATAVVDRVHRHFEGINLDIPLKKDEPGTHVDIDPRTDPKKRKGSISVSALRRNGGLRHIQAEIEGDPLDEVGNGREKAALVYNSPNDRLEPDLSDAKFVLFGHTPGTPENSKLITVAVQYQDAQPDITVNGIALGNLEPEQKAEIKSTFGIDVD